MNNATRRYDTIEFNVDSKAEYSALSSTRSQKKKLKQRKCPFDTVQASRCCGSNSSIRRFSNISTSCRSC